MKCPLTKAPHLVISKQPMATGTTASTNQARQTNGLEIRCLGGDAAPAGCRLSLCRYVRARSWLVNLSSTSTSQSQHVQLWRLYRELGNFLSLPANPPAGNAAAPIISGPSIREPSVGQSGPCNAVLRLKFGGMTEDGGRSTCN